MTGGWNRSPSLLVVFLVRSCVKFILMWYVSRDEMKNSTKSTNGVG